MDQNEHDRNVRSRQILDIERDLSRIKDRLNILEDHFEDGGAIAQMAEAIHKLAVEIEALKSTRQVGDAER